MDISTAYCSGNRVDSLGASDIMHIFQRKRRMHGRNSYDQMSTLLNSAVVFVGHGTAQARGKKSF